MGAEGGALYALSGRPGLRIEWRDKWQNERAKSLSTSLSTYISPSLSIYCTRLHTAAHGCTWFAGGCGWLWMADMGCRGLFRWLCCHLLCCGLWVALLSLSCRSLFTLSHTKYTPQPLSPPPGVRTIDRFFLGGPTSLRGFQERGVGPRAPIRAVSGASPYGDALGGDVSALASVALQLPLPSRRLQVRSLC